MSAAKPTSDATLGMAWWNRLTERERLHWLLMAGSDVPADAWAVFRAGLPQYPSSSTPPRTASYAAGAAHHRDP